MSDFLCKMGRTPNSGHEPRSAGSHGGRERGRDYWHSTPSLSVLYEEAKVSAASLISGPSGRRGLFRIRLSGSLAIAFARMDCLSVCLCGWMSVCVVGCLSVWLEVFLCGWMSVCVWLAVCLLYGLFLGV